MKRKGTPAKTSSPKILRIKLSRDKVRVCHGQSTSAGFSYTENIEGQQAIIYCTEGKRITDTFIGIVKRASRKSRNWVLAQVQELRLQ